MNSVCPQFSSLSSVLTSSHNYTCIYICLITCTHSYIHLVMRPCTLNPSSLRFKGIVRSWRWCGRCRMRYQSWGVSHKAGAFVKPAVSPLWPNTRSTSHRSTSRGWIRLGESGRSDQRGSSLPQPTNRSVAKRFMTCPSYTPSAGFHLLHQTLRPLE